jgi:MFS family permease
MGALLGAISLTSLQGGRPGIYLAPFLLLQGFNESNIGVVLFVGGIVKLLSQPVAGILIDRASDKRWLLLLGNTLVIAACIAIYANTSNVMFGAIAIGIGESITFPALYSLTLGLVSSSNSSDDDDGDALKRQIAFNESCQHLGNLLFAVMAGVLVLWYPTDASLFLLLVASMGLVASVLTLLIDNSLVDQHAARGGGRGRRRGSMAALTADGGGGAAAAIDDVDDAAVASKPLGGKKDDHDGNEKTVVLPDTETDIEATAAAVPEPPLPLSILLGRADVLGFLTIVLLFHLGNASMLPLLAQKLTLSHGENGIMFTSLSIVIAQACMYISSSMFPRCVQSVGINQALLVALLCIPVRGALILMLLVHMPSVALLLLTQILDGLAGGIMGCVRIWYTFFLFVSSLVCLSTLLLSACLL